MIIETGTKGIPLRDIIQKLGNKDYPYISCRILYTDSEGNQQDEFFGCAEYVNKELKPLDGDSYSLDDLYVKYEEWDLSEVSDMKGTGLTVWEYGELMTCEEWKERNQKSC